jgi:aspartyl-tRNA(Asn)/glutamyl-tRNA(Gln) amidotransferase subunit A
MKTRKIKQTISEISSLIRLGEYSPVDLTQSVLERIDTVDNQLNAYITVLKDRAMRSAESAERAINSGKYKGPLHGVPIALKDIFATKDIRTTCGSKILVEHFPDYDATVVERLEGAGAILLGKLNMLEFATGDIINPTFGATRNPWDLERTTGGSSSGSAAAVAASLCFGALGTDTGGSIRIPSSLCGIVGLKPTYGRVSRYGVTPLSWSLDHVGPMTKSVSDAAIMLQVISGGDPKDTTAAELPVPNYLKALTGDIQDLKVGVPRQHFLTPMYDEVRKSFDKAIRKLEGLGANINDVEYNYVQRTIPLYGIITSCEAASYHERYFTRHSLEYDQRVVFNRILPGRFIPAVHYLKAQRYRNILIKEIDKLFKLVDVIITPTTPITAFKIREDQVKIGSEKMSAREALSRFTRLFNLVGLPSITVPCGFTSSGLPIGLQIASRRFDEATSMRVAHTYEINTPWHKRRPVLSHITPCFKLAWNPLR